MATRHTLVALSEDMKVLREIEEVASACFTVISTRSVERALGLVKADASVAVIVADQVLFGSVGTDVLKAAQTARPEIRRVLISSADDLADIIEGLHAGVIERILYKPIRAQELNAAITLPGMAAKRVATA